MNLYITAEITSRELEAKTFLACCAASKGFDVIIGHEDMIRRVAVLKEPGLFLDKSIHSEYPPLYTRMKRLGHRVAVNDEEGLVFNPKQYTAFNLTDAVARSVDMFFAWGNCQRDIFIKNLPTLTDSTFAIGNPRLDLLQPQLRPFHQSSVDKLRDEYGNFVLINTRFAFANNAIGGAAYRKRLAAGKNGPNIEYLLNRFEFDKLLFESFVEMQKQLCERYPEKNFVLRPHPSEAMTPWENLADKYPNLHVVRKGNVHQWILASEMLIHNGCATAIESFYLDTPCVCYRPVTSSECDIELPNSVSYNVFNFEDLCDCIERKHDTQMNSIRSDWEAILKPYIQTTPTTLTAPEVVKKLQELSMKAAPADYLYAITAKIDAWVRHWNRSLKWWLRRFKHSDTQKAKNPKWVQYSVEEYSNLVHSFDFYDPAFANLEVSQIYKDCFLVTHPNKK